MFSIQATLYLRDCYYVLCAQERFINFIAQRRPGWSFPNRYLTYRKAKMLLMDPGFHEACEDEGYFDETTGGAIYFRIENDADLQSDEEVHHRATFRRAFVDYMMFTYEGLNKKGDIFQKDFLYKLNDATQDLFYIPGVARHTVTSLWTPNTRFIAVTEEGLEAGDVIPANFAGEPEDIDTVMQNTLRADLVGRLVSVDFRSAMIRAELLLPLCERAPLSRRESSWPVCERDGCCASNSSASADSSSTRAVRGFCGARPPFAGGTGGAVRVRRSPRRPE